MLFKDCERTDRRTTTTTDGEWSQYLTLSLRLRWAKKAYLSNTSSDLVRLSIQTYVRQYVLSSETCKTPGWAKRIDEILSFADRKDMKKFFDALKTVYDPQSSGTTPLLSADGTSLLTDKEAILKRWAEHFDDVLNQQLFISDEAINRLPQVECNPLLLR